MSEAGGSPRRDPEGPGLRQRCPRSSTAFFRVRLARGVGGTRLPETSRPCHGGGRAAWWGGAGGAERRRSPPTAARRPLAGCGPSSPAAGRRASRTLRAIPPRARLLSRPGRGGAGREPSQCARAAPSPAETRPSPQAPAPAPPPTHPPASVGGGGGGSGGCRDWNPPAGARRRRREEGGENGQEGSGSGAYVRARRGSHGRSRGDRAGAAARRGRRPSRAPAAPRRLAAPTPLRAEGWMMSSPGSG